MKKLKKKNIKKYYKLKETNFEVTPKLLDVKNSIDLKKHLTSNQKISFAFSLTTFWKMNEKMGCSFYTDELEINSLY